MNWWCVEIEYAWRDSHKLQETSAKRETDQATSHHTAHFSPNLPTGADLDRLKQEVRGSNLKKDTKALVLALIDEKAPRTA
jgi:hypothetical protein